MSFYSFTFNLLKEKKNNSPGFFKNCTSKDLSRFKIFTIWSTLYFFFDDVDTESLINYQL